MEQEMTSQQWALFMFICLTQQAEAWSYALKGTLNAKTAHFLKKYMRSANEFSNHIGQYYDMDELHDQAEVWTKLLEYIRSKSHTDQERLYWGLREFMDKMEVDNNHEAWAQCPVCLTNYDQREHETCPKCTTDELS
jgi:uncharacterized paraquat-inducible protein A